MVDDELRALCKYWSIPMREPPTKPKEKPDAANTRQITLRTEIKVSAGELSASHEDRVAPSTHQVF